MWVSPGTTGQRNERRRVNGADSRSLVAWRQIRVGGIPAPPLAALETGASFAWSGPAVPVPAARGLAGAVRHLAGTALPLMRPQSGCAYADLTFGREIELSLGPARFTAILVEAAAAARPFLLFAGRRPPPGTMLTISRGLYAPPDSVRHLGEGAGVICFSPDTPIDTPEGPRRAAELREGDLVLTADSGAQQVLWIGRRRFAAADLGSQPEHRPVRLNAAGGIVVSPRHRIVVRTPEVRSLFGDPEVLVAAEDLVDGTRIVRDEGARGVEYVHLMLSGHEVLHAGGLACESFHPGTTDLGTLAPDDRARLARILPVADVQSDPGWAPARRCLDRTEALHLRSALRH